MSEMLFSQVCHSYVPMAIATFKSLEKAWLQPRRLNLLEDGTVTASDWEQFHAAFPTAVFHRKPELKGRIEQFLSKNAACLAFYRSNVFGPKLFEPPFLSDGDCHYCDCDMLFFRRLKRLYPLTPGLVFLGELAQDTFGGVCHSMFDWVIRYRIPLARNVNGGIYRIPSGFQDLDKIEWFLKRSKNAARPMLIEQTCWAFLLANEPHRLIAPEEVLSTKDMLPKENFPPVIHFIANQKQQFWKFAALVDKALEREPIDELRTVQGRRVEWSSITAQIASGFRRRAASAISLKSRRRIGAGLER